MSELYDECHRILNYDAETGLLTWKVQTANRIKVSDIAGTKDRHGYFTVGIQGKRHKAHRIIWLMVTGNMPVNHVDHINGDASDNRLCNLREATNTENMCNRGMNKNNKTGLKGVYFRRQNRKNPYLAQIMSKGKTIHLGIFPTPELAYEARCLAAKKYHGEFSNMGVSA